MHRRPPGKLRRRASAWWQLLLLLLVAGSAPAAPGDASLSPTSAPPGSPAEKVTVQPPPLPGRSPVEIFRELLALPTVERRAALTNRPPDSQQRLLEKLKEYERLPADERELRLQATELRWFLQPLLALPATNRATRLAQMPAHLHDLVTARLRQWDILPPPLRQQLLEDDRTFRLYLQLESGTAEQRAALLRSLPPERRQQVEAGFDRWRALDAAEREKAVRRMDRYFTLSDAEKQKVLASLSTQERGAMEKTLAAFERLPPQQRQRCIRSLQKLAALSPDEQAQFLKNAERWKSMTPAERESFRNLVAQAPVLPPLPPVPTLPAGLRTGRVTTARTN